MATNGPPPNRQRPWKIFSGAVGCHATKAPDAARRRDGPKGFDQTCGGRQNDGAMTLIKRLRNWLGDDGEKQAVPPDGTLGPMPLPDPLATPRAFADALLTVARDGTADARRAALLKLGHLPSHTWPAVEERLRSGWFTAHPVPDTFRLVIEACHRDGRVREAALARLGGRTDHAVIAVFALRTGDWVAQVRQVARTTVAGWAKHPSPTVRAEFAYRQLILAELAYRLGDRREGAWLLDHVDLLLREYPERFLASQEVRLRRAAYRATTDMDQLSLIAAATRDPDPVIRAQCARRAVANASTEQLNALLTGRPALVRAEALRTLIARADPDAADTPDIADSPGVTGKADEATRHAAVQAAEIAVEKALTDRHPSVREIARQAHPDPSAHYRRLITAASPDPSAIAGLSETGGPADLIIPSLSHPSSRGRVEAVRGLRRLGAATPELLTPLLTDDSPAVLRQVVMSVSAVDPALLWPLLDETHPVHVRFAGFRLLGRGDAWQRVTADLRLLDDPDQRLQSTARDDVRQWLRTEAATSFRGPTPERAAELAELIDRHHQTLGDGTVRELRFHAGLS